jgi:hypothetical protein
VLCFNEGVYLPLVQHINSSSSSRSSTGSLRAASAGSSRSNEGAHTTWGSSHASSRAHSGRRQEQQQQLEVLGSQAAGVPVAAGTVAAAGGGGTADGWQQEGCRIVLHSDSLDLPGGNAQLRASDLQLLRANSSNSGGDSSNCWASRWLCDNGAGGGGAPVTAGPAAPAAVWEPSASVLQCCSEEAEDEGDFGDNVWEGED